MARAGRGDYWFALELAAIAAVWTVCYWIVLPKWASPALQLHFTAGVILASLYLVYVSPRLIHKDDPAEQGLGGWRVLFVRADNLREALARYAKLTALVASAMVALALLTRQEPFASVSAPRLLARMITYFPSALCQTYLFFGFFLTRIKKAAARRGVGKPFASKPKLFSCLVAAALFSAFHFPNPHAMVLTFGIGVFWARLYHDTPNLYVQGLSHSLLAALSSALISGNTRIGAFYYQPGVYPMRKIFPIINQLI